MLLTGLIIDSSNQSGSHWHLITIVWAEGAIHTTLLSDPGVLATMNFAFNLFSLNKHDGHGSHMLFYSINVLQTLQPARPTARQPDRQPDRQTGRQTARQAGRQASRQTNRLEYKMLLHHFVHSKLNKNSILIAQPWPRAADRESPFLTL